MRLTTFASITLASALSLPVSAASAPTNRDRSVEQALAPASGFGRAVAVAGETLAIGSLELEGIAGAVYLFTRGEDGWIETAKVVPSDGPARGFGGSVALSEDVLLVGASDATVDGIEGQGAVYVFIRAGAAWTETAKLTAADGAAGDAFGFSLALSDDTLVVGAPQWGFGHSGTGAAYVFTRADDGQWTESAKVIASDGQAGDRFGWSVAVDGDTLAVGVARNFAEGWAYAFTRSGETWTEAAKLIPSDGAESDFFGWSVTVSDNTVVVGAWQATIDGNVSQGAAYVFMGTADTWTEMAKLTATDGTSGDQLGQSVVLEGETLVARAAGAAYVFTGAGDTWTEVAKLTASGGSGLLPQNVAVALDGETLLVGGLAPTGEAGVARVFTGADDTWEETATLTLGFRQFFAEGATGFYQTDLALFNTSETETAQAVVTLYPEAPNETVELPVTLEPRARHTIDVNAAMGDQDGGVSIRLESDQPVAAARQMRWAATGTYGSTLENGMSDTAVAWSFAEGATYFTNLFYLIANPYDADANVTIQYLRGSGEPITQELVVPGRSRRTIWANDVPGLAFAEVAAVISADRPIVAERAMYLGSRFDAGTASRGAPELSEEWFFAEGETSFFDTFLVLGNPGDEMAEVTVTYQLPDGSTFSKIHEVPAAARGTILVDQDDPKLTSTAVGMQVSSSVPIVAERAMWYGPTPATWYEGHVSLGATEPGHVWAIAEGASGRTDTEDTYVMVANASHERGPVRLTVVRDDGTTAEEIIVLESFQRRTVRIQELFPTVENQRFSVLVESVGMGEDFIPTTVEYARYQSTEGRFGNAGGASLATLIPR